MSWRAKLGFAAILAFTLAPLLPAQTADTLFAQAKAQAATEHKNVLLVFSASWCGPCKLYERFLEDPEMKPITERAFVVVRIDVGESENDTRHSNTPGGVELRAALGAEGDPGYPFLVATSAEGKPLVNSYRNGDAKDNVGYPVLPQEIDWYLKMLERAAPSLSQADLAATRNWLKKHAPR